MKHKLAANLAIAFAVAGWLLMGADVLGNLGDYGPTVSESEIRAANRLSLIAAFAGSGFILTSVWLSGFSMASEPIRSRFALFLSIAPIVVLLFIGLAQGHAL